MQLAYNSIWPFAPSTFHEDGRIDTGGMKLVLECLIDHGADGIRCNAVAPGWIDTDLNLDFVETMEAPDVFRRDIGKIHPLGRTGKPEEVANLIAFLASSDADFITGQVYTVDDGRMTKLSLP